MPANLVLAPEAEQDVRNAYDWYEAQRVGLGDEFLDAANACFQTIVQSPERYAIYVRDYRRILLRRFPYVVYYEHVAAVVTIYAVYHTSRSPAGLQQRLR